MLALIILKHNQTITMTQLMLLQDLSVLFIGLFFRNAILVGLFAVSLLDVLHAKQNLFLLFISVKSDHDSNECGQQDEKCVDKRRK